MSKTISPFVLLLAAAVQPALASAPDPGALQQLRILEQERQRQIERLEQQRAADPTVDVQPERPAADDPGVVRFFVREIRFGPSEIFSAEELRAFAQRLEGREQTLAALQGLVAEINAEYRRRGMVAAQAVLPPQDVSAGVIEIRLIEGRLGTIRLRGNDSTSENHITRRIGTKPGDLVALPELEQDLLRFNRTNDAQLRAQLVPGEVFATTDLLLEVTEPPRHLLRAFVDNDGGRYSGEQRLGLAYHNRSVLGFRDEFSLSATRASGQESYALSYGAPFNRSGGRLTLSYHLDDTQIRYGPFKSLDITGESRSTTLSLRQPLHIGRTSQIDLLGGVNSREMENRISGVFLNRTETRGGSIGLVAQRADTRGYWIGSYSYTDGRAEADGIGSSQYRHGRGWLHRQQQIGGQWSARASLSFQHAIGPLPLPASEQMIIGGQGTVRGYPVGTFSGDSGHTLSVEVHHPIGAYALGEAGTSLAASGFFFMDYGRVQPYRPPNSTLRQYEQLTSSGLGLNASLGKHVTARTTLSYMFDEIPDRMSSRFSANVQFVASF